MSNKAIRVQKGMWLALALEIWKHRNRTFLIMVD